MSAPDRVWVTIHGFGPGIVREDHDHALQIAEALYPTAQADINVVEYVRADLHDENADAPRQED